MEIHEHAVDRYFTRVKEIDESYLKYASDQERKKVKGLMRMVARYPSHVYHEEPNKPPVHIGEDIAIPVDHGEGGEDTVVPTAYKAETFLEKMDDRAIN